MLVIAFKHERNICAFGKQKQRKHAMPSMIQVAGWQQKYNIVGG